MNQFWNDYKNHFLRIVDPKSTAEWLALMSYLLCLVILGYLLLTLASLL
jgi:hypothetical protein